MQTQLGEAHEELSPLQLQALMDRLHFVEAAKHVDVLHGDLLQPTLLHLTPNPSSPCPFLVALSRCIAVKHALKSSANKAY